MFTWEANYNKPLKMLHHKKFAHEATFFLTLLVIGWINVRLFILTNRYVDLWGLVKLLYRLVCISFSPHLPYASWLCLLHNARWILVCIHICSRKSQLYFLYIGVFLPVEFAAEYLIIIFFFFLFFINALMPILWLAVTEKQVSCVKDII